MEKIQLQTIVGVAVIVAVLASVITASITGSVVKVNYDKYGKYKVYTTDETYSKTEVQNIIDQRAKSLLEDYPWDCRLVGMLENDSRNGYEVCKSTIGGKCLFTLGVIDFAITNLTLNDDFGEKRNNTRLNNGFEMYTYINDCFESAYKLSEDLAEFEREKSGNILQFDLRYLCCGVSPQGVVNSSEKGQNYTKSSREIGSKILGAKYQPQ